MKHVFRGFSWTSVSPTGTEWIPAAFICQSGTFQDLQKSQLKIPTKKIINGSIYMYLKTSVQTYGASQGALVVKKVKVTQSCPTLSDPMDSTVHGILQSRTLEWVAIHSLLQGDLAKQGSNPGL